MKKLFFCIFLTVCVINSNIASGIKVPAVWSAPNSKGIEQLGFYQDGDKYIFALKNNRLATKASSGRIAAGFYINADNNIDTGRFAGDGGYDLQLNVNIYPVMKLKALIWKTGEKSPIVLPIYVDDYQISVQDNVLYLAVKKSIFRNHQIGKKFTLRVTFHRKYQDVASIRVNQSKIPAETIAPPMNFIRFGAIATARKKFPYAEIVSSKNGVTIWNSFMDRYSPREKMPVKTKRVKRLTISAARGESESMQLGITTTHTPEKLELSASGLTGPGGKKIPASQFQIKYVGYVSDAFGKKYGDILFPEYHPANALNNFVLITVKVPDDTPAGIYRGSLQLKINGKPADNPPLALRVYDFSLPSAPNFPTAFCIKNSQVSRFYRVSGKPFTPQKVKTQVAAMRLLCSKYRIGPRFLGAKPKIKIKNGKMEIDWCDFDKALDKFFNIRKFAAFQMIHFVQMGSHDRIYPKAPFFNKSKPPSFDEPTFRKFWPRYIRKLYQHLKEKKCLDRALFVIWDEPYSTQYPWINDLLGMAKKTAPNIQWGVFIDRYAPEIAGRINTWIVQASLMGGIYKKGRNIWLYNDERMGSFTNPAADVRGCFWQAWNYKLGGYLNSEIDAWSWGLRKPYDSYTNLAATHMWFYPDLNGGTPLPSLRLALIRDGVDDYDYLKIFSEKLTEAKANNHPGLAEAQKLRNKLRRVMPKLNKYKKIDFKLNSISELNEWRDRIADQIVKLSK